MSYVSAVLQLFQLENACQFQTGAI